MNRFAALLLLVPLCSSAQEKSAFQPMESRLALDLSAGAQYQPQQFPHTFFPVTFAGADLQATYRIGKLFGINAQTFLPVSDPVSQKWNSLDPEGGFRAPRYNQSAVTGTLRLLSLSARTKARSGNGFQRESQYSLRFGYFYTQQSWYHSEDYNRYDITPEGYSRYITGYRGHSGTIGVDYSSVRYMQASTTAHHFYADLVYAFDLSVSAVQQSLQLETRRTTVDEDFERDPVGARIGYTFKRYGKGRIGFLAGAEGLLKPIVRYRPNPDFYVVRGGESVQPFTFVLKAGITYRL